MESATLTEAAQLALRYHRHHDEMNAAIHCASVKYSPITFKLAAALNPTRGHCGLGVPNCDACTVLEHENQYDLDHGR